MPRKKNRYARRGRGKMIYPDIPTARRRLTSHTNGTNEKNSTPLSYWKDTLYFRFENNEEKLESWLCKILPVAQLSADRYDTTVFIENGASVAGEIDKILDKCDVKGQRTVGLYGHYQVTMLSAPHEESTTYLSSPYRKVRRIFMRFVRRNGILPDATQALRDTLTQVFLSPDFDVEDAEDLLGQALMNKVEGVEDFLTKLVSMTGSASTIQQDGIAECLARRVEEYCQNHLNCHTLIPPWLTQGRNSSMYEKEPDMSYQPAYYSVTTQETGTVECVSAICEVAMNDSLSKGIFDVMTSFAGTRFLLDLGLVVDIEANEDTDSLDRIRLILVDGTVENLVELSRDNSAVAFVARDKIENRLQNLQTLQNYLNSDPRQIFQDSPPKRSLLESYRLLQNSINYTISELQNALNTVVHLLHQPIDDSEIRNEENDIVQACEVLLNNSTVVELYRDNGVIRSNVDALSFPAVSYLGLLLGPGFETHVTLTANDMHKLYHAVEKAFRLKNLEKMQVPIAITVSQGYINPERYSTFVDMQGSDFDRDAFRNGGSYTTRNLKMGFFTLDAIKHFALMYHPELGGRSKRIMMAAGLHWMSNASKMEREREGDFIYDLVREMSPETTSWEPEPLMEQDAQNATAEPAGRYGRFLSDLLSDHADASENSKDRFRAILNNKAVKDLVQAGNNESRLREMVARRTLDGFLDELGEDILEARDRLIREVNPGRRRVSRASRSLS
uniref:ARAD1A13574p n=1 Tax=Blastobotrys adeninivorans TaxID=409370 RepID=A0A060SXJ7_BLAAD